MDVLCNFPQILIQCQRCVLMADRDLAVHLRLSLNGRHASGCGLRIASPRFAQLRKTRLKAIASKDFRGFASSQSPCLFSLSINSCTIPLHSRLKFF